MEIRCQQQIDNCYLRSGVQKKIVRSGVVERHTHHHLMLPDPLNGNRLDVRRTSRLGEHGPGDKHKDRNCRNGQQGTLVYPGAANVVLPAMAEDSS